MEALPAAVRGVPAALFDTRYCGVTRVMGSAAAEAAKAIRKAGGDLAAEPQSLFMVRTGPMERQTLEPGEIDRTERRASAVTAAANAGRQS
jgi:hypothetical protein